jgi:hypothetical protein
MGAGLHGLTISRAPFPKMFGSISQCSGYATLLYSAINTKANAVFSAASRHTFMTVSKIALYTT